MGWVKKYWRRVVLQIAVLAAMAALLRHDPAMPYEVGSAVVLVALSGAIFRSPQLLAKILQYPVLIRRAGFAFIALAILAVILDGVYQVSIQSGTAVLAFLLPMLLGCLLITLPRSAEGYLASRKDPAQPRAPADKKFEDVKDALIFPFQHLRAYFRIVVPAAVLFCVVPLLTFQAAAYADGAIADFFAPVGKYGDGVRATYYAAYAITLLYVVPATAIAWHRYAQLNVFPRFVFTAPNARFWRYGWRVVTFGYAVNTLTKWIDASGGEMAKFADPHTVQLTQFGAVYLAWGVALWAFSSMAIQLAAICEGDRKMDITAALYATRPLGNAYRLGFVFSILPYLAASILFNRFAIRPLVLSLSIKQIGAFGFDLLVLTAIACGATYLSRVYLRVTGRGLANYPG
jgi:hypothetical protein